MKMQVQKGLRRHSDYALDWSSVQGQFTKNQKSEYKKK